jgi:hypothetical protein
VSRKALVIILIVAVLGGIIFRDPLRYILYSRSFQRTFMSLLKESINAEKNLDLRKFAENSWDEMVWVGPYEDPCSHGLEFKEWWHPCRSTQDEKAFKLYFINNKKVVAGFNVLRNDLEFVESSGLPKRIPKQNALFKFDHFENYPTVQLITE